jgi:hypothetical protein
MSATLVSWAVLGFAFAEGTKWTFEDQTADRPPAEWTVAKTGEGPGSVWRIVEDPTAPDGAKVLAQTSSEGPRPLFNLCVADEKKLVDLDLTVSLKAVEGEIDQGGGPVWRYQDANNYYIARVNPLEDNFRVYKVVNGERSQLGTAAATAATGEWHTIRIVHEGDHIRCYLNDELHLDVRDDTFTKAGGVGLWTKADAVTYFDGFQATQPAE